MQHQLDQLQQQAGQYQQLRQQPMMQQGINIVSGLQTSAGFNIGSPLGNGYRLETPPTLISSSAPLSTSLQGQQGYYVQNISQDSYNIVNQSQNYQRYQN